MVRGNPGKKKCPFISGQKVFRRFISGRKSWGRRGFTLIELLVVMAIIALLASLAAAVSMGKIRQSKESALKEDLHQMRKAIDDFDADTGKYPSNLGDLVDHRYLRSIPVDPMTESADSWQLVKSKEAAQKDGIVDIHSGSLDKSSGGDNYSGW